MHGAVRGARFELHKAALGENLSSMPRQSIGERIAWARERAGLNKNRFARELGTSWQHVDHWEKGRTEPSLGSMRRIAELLGVSVDFLLGVRDEPDAAVEPKPLERFLAELAPKDLTPSEQEWLRSAPLDASRASPEDYLRLLENLRNIGRASEAAAPKRSGRRRKVDVKDVERVVAQRKRGSV